MSASADRGILMGFIDKVSHPNDWQSGRQTIEDRGKKIDADRPFGPNPLKPITISQPRGQLSSWKRA
jgi:hypothetical protein